LKKRKEQPFFWFMVLTLWLFWIAVTASVHYQGLLAGAVLAYLLALLNRDLFFARAERPFFAWCTLVLFVRYGLHLIVAVINSSVQVAYMVLQPAMPISPGTVRYPLSLKKDLSKVILANSITLTPGTLTVLLDDDEIVVHALTEESARAEVNWPLAAELEAIEKVQEEKCL